MSDKRHRYYKHTKFHQNPRGDPEFLVDLTWNDPYVTHSICVINVVTNLYWEQLSLVVV